MAAMARQCSIDYFKAVDNPFDADAVCVPTSFNVPSTKVKRYLRGTFTTGTNGLGYICLSPGRAIFKDSVAVVASTTTYNGTLANCPYIADANGAILNFPSDYTTSATDESTCGRIVAAGLRIKNRTPIMSRGATVYGYEAPNHATLVSPTSSTDTANVMAFQSWPLDDTCVECGTADDKWTSVVWHPTSVADTVNSTSGNLISNTVNIPSLGNFTLGFYTLSTGGTQTFAFEAVVLYEVSGFSPASETPSLSDPSGLAAVLNLMQSNSMRVARIGERFPIARRILASAASWGPVAKDIGKLAIGLSKLI